MPIRAVAAVSLAAVVLTSAAGKGSTSGSVRRPARTASSPPRAVTYVAPLPEPLHVVRSFDPPDTRYGPGHLGVDLRAGRRAVVRAAGDGVVSFAGLVAGRGVVVVTHRDGIRTEYEPVRPMVAAGVRVRASQPIGILRGVHVGCAGVCLHWGARRGERYVNPLDLLHPLGPVVLLPWNPR